MDGPRQRCGVLLAGGTSTRFGGGPKGLASLGAMRVADGPLRALERVCDEVVIAANDPDATVWFASHTIVRDAIPGRGALGALETALRAANGRTLVVCAWDMPFVTAATLETLAAVVDAGASCCVPQHADGLLEPLCAAYAPICADVATALLAQGERAAHLVQQACGGVGWSIADHVSGEQATRVFFNVNTHDDLRLAASWLTLHPNLA